ncbi:MAG: ATP synthase F1 subunit delta [Mycoplasmatales bacterium]|nr:ATP synthase F1 subunit delta [Mycoplasmatales bacterium]
MTEYINGYSLALFSLAKDEKKLTKYKDEALLIMESIIKTEEFEVFLDSRSIDTEIKNKVIKKSFDKKINKNLYNFLLLIVKRNKVKIILPVLKKLVKLINNDFNINEGIVYSARKLTQKEIKGISLKTEKILKTKISLVNKVDKSLISGFRIEVGDELIEDSITSRIEEMKEQLLRKELNVS